MENFLNQLKISDLVGSGTTKAIRTRFYKSHLIRLRTLLGKHKAGIHIPGFDEGRFDRSAPGHFHATPELFLQVSGSTVFHCPSGRLDLSPGGICVMPTGIPHDEHFFAERDPYVTIVIMMPRSGVSFHFGYIHEDGSFHCGPTDHYRVNSREVVIRLIQFIAEHGAKNAIPDDYVGHLMLAIIDRLIDGADHPMENSRGASPAIQRCRELIMVHQDENSFNVQALASMLDYHPDYLSRLFQRETGQTLTAYLNQERISRAKFHLGGSLSINEIAWSCGFSHTSYFIRVFKQLTGMTPTEYRLAEA